MRTDSAMNPGRLHVLPKHPEHVHGDSDDSTTTRWDKAQAMGINLPLPKPHRNARGIMNGVWMGSVLWAVLLVIGWLFWRWAAR